jgi:hypothetical protein
MHQYFSPYVVLSDPKLSKAVSRTPKPDVRLSSATHQFPVASLLYGAVEISGVVNAVPPRYVSYFNAGAW